ncbi:MAG: end-binding protein Ku [Chthoniobacter sp.]|nr:end-binding protein Ku [Chthoniobacter sp.]
MHFAQEVLEPDELRSTASMELSEKDLTMAKALIDSMANEWQPEQYQDRYQTAVRAMVERKIQKLPPAERKAAPRAASDVVDLLAVLQQSLKETGPKEKRPLPRACRRSAQRRAWSSRSGGRRPCEDVNKSLTQHSQDPGKNLDSRKNGRTLLVRPVVSIPGALIRIVVEAAAPETKEKR